ncbi:exodeoxyribonuclease VII small subunit [Clostridium sp. D2Q-11]|uniref:Exodeoxyribonuclease 7 small subunit n=1 Tax=Anaeromonas frigoriresistens TaxID=2683708 RepID=A0A942UWP2_9FIRM|nr:exodeoxyribonuclease VII small subunit [Anaeromonas frigoriresistens]MBS4539983.1 exodeoxyribonuclease VII small subunit [Anaeromonas frigoriresistens]
MGKEKEVKFEEAISQLEDIVDRLETGDLTIDSAIDEFKKGIQLYNKCYKKIEETEGKIKLILEDGEGIVKESDFTNID